MKGRSIHKTVNLILQELAMLPVIGVSCLPLINDAETIYYQIGICSDDWQSILINIREWCPLSDEDVTMKVKSIHSQLARRSCNTIRCQLVDTLTALYANADTCAKEDYSIVRIVDMAALVNVIGEIAEGLGQNDHSLTQSDNALAGLYDFNEK